LVDAIPLLGEAGLLSTPVKTLLTACGVVRSFLVSTGEGESLSGRFSRPESEFLFSSQ